MLWDWVCVGGRLLMIAHFTEHMLFMGSGEYPAEGEYDRFISIHSGMNNAWTSSGHTLYYFNINPQGLLGALDRFSQFFVSPVNPPSVR
jgi:insulysin